MREAVGCLSGCECGGLGAPSTCPCPAIWSVGAAWAREAFSLGRTLLFCSSKLIA